MAPEHTEESRLAAEAVRVGEVWAGASPPDGLVVDGRLATGDKT